MRRVPMRVAFLRSEILEARADVVREESHVEAHKIISCAPETARPDRSWRRWASCRTIDTAMFFPGRGDVWLTRAAVAVCANCGVRQTCLEAALVEEQGLGESEVHGIRGGLTASQRLALNARGSTHRRRRRRVEATAS